MTNPQAVPLPPAPANTPKTKIVMLEPDQRLCTDLLGAGFPQNVVLEIAEALAEKIAYLAEIENYRTQNGDLLKANQTLLARAEEAESELRKTKKELKSWEDEAESGGLLPG